MSIYDEIANIPKSLMFELIDPSTPSVTQQHIEDGFMTRYFVKQVNHANGEITEIDQLTYSRLKSNNLYKVISLEWRISGALDDPPSMRHSSNLGVISANKLSVKNADQELKGMRSRLVNMTQFWQGK
jgi:hypothetical protein